MQIVTPKVFEIPHEITLESGKTLSDIKVAYETIGTLNRKKSNAILIFHALSGDAHVSGYHTTNDKKPGWWDLFVGPKKSIDTNKYFVICANILGGCKGSTGPSSVNQKTSKPFGSDFPIITIKDMVYIQKLLVDSLGIDRLLAVIGGSMGGMQALQFAVDYPKKSRLTIPIACAYYQSAQNIAFHEAGRQAIITDPNWNKGDYYDKAKSPAQGLAVARMLSHITYMSKDSLKKKFGRRFEAKESFDFSFDTDFQVESYLKHQGKSFVERFDANSYIYITKAIDYFDLTNNGKKSIEEIFRGVKSKFLVISFTSDWLYSTRDNKEIVWALQSNNVDVSFLEIDSDYGHDSFLIKNKVQEDVLRNFLGNEMKNL